MRQKIVQELMKHEPVGGKTMVRAYLFLVRLGKSLTRLTTKLEEHHILPRGVGWWKAYENRSWNKATVPWGFHFALHGLLAFMYPNNPRIISAVKATKIGRIGSKLDKHRERILACAADGMSVPEAARRLQLGSGVLWRWAERNEVKFRNGNFRIDKWNEEIRSLAKDGVGAAEIARKLNISRTGLGAWAERNKVKLQLGRGLILRAKEIRNYAKSGLSMPETAKKLKIKKLTLFQWARRNKVKFQRFGSKLDKAAWAAKRRKKNEHHKDR